MMKPLFGFLFLLTTVACSGGSGETDTSDPLRLSNHPASVDPNKNLGDYSRDELLALCQQASTTSVTTTLPSSPSIERYSCGVAGWLTASAGPSKAKSPAEFASICGQQRDTCVAKSKATESVTTKPFDPATCDASVTAEVINYKGCAATRDDILACVTERLAQFNAAAEGLPDPCLSTDGKAPAALQLPPAATKCAKLAQVCPYFRETLAGGK